MMCLQTTLFRDVEKMKPRSRMRTNPPAETNLDPELCLKFYEIHLTVDN